MAELSRDEFTRWMETLQEDIRGVHDRLDKLNDRTRTAEQRIAVLDDRAGPARAAAWGGGIGGLMVGVIEGLKWLLHK